MWGDAEPQKSKVLGQWGTLVPPLMDGTGQLLLELTVTTPLSSGGGGGKGCTNGWVMGIEE